MKKQYISGQATTEMAIMLIGFTTLLLGLIFTCGLEIANNQMLLDSKFNTEKYINSDKDREISGGTEIRSWEYSSVNGAEIPFLLSDRKVSSGTSSVSDSYDAVKDASSSRAESYKFVWTSPKNFNDKCIEDDFVSEPFSNAYSAAELVSRAADVGTYNPLLPEKASCNQNVDLTTLGETFFRWFGIKLSKNTLERNITNRVYLPVNGEK